MIGNNSLNSMLRNYRRNRRDMVDPVVSNTAEAHMLTTRIEVTGPNIDLATLISIAGDGPDAIHGCLVIECTESVYNAIRDVVIENGLRNHRLGCVQFRYTFDGLLYNSLIQDRETSISLNSDEESDEVFTGATVTMRKRWRYSRGDLIMYLANLSRTTRGITLKLRNAIFDRETDYLVWLGADGWERFRLRLLAVDFYPVDGIASPDFWRAGFYEELYCYASRSMISRMGASFVTKHFCCVLTGVFDRALYNRLAIRYGDFQIDAEELATYWGAIQMRQLYSEISSEADEGQTVGAFLRRYYFTTFRD